MTRARLRVGLIGHGRIGRRHAAAIRAHPRAVLAALADPDPARRAGAGPAASFPDWAAMLAEAPLDAVVVATPPAVLADAAARALELGLAAYVEKPLALTAAGRDQLARAAARAPAAAGLNLRRHPLVEAARARIAQGGLGALRLAAARQFAPRTSHADWRADPGAGGDALTDLASHHLDLLPFLAGRPLDPGTLRATFSADASGEDVLVQGRLEGGAAVSIQAAQTAGRWLHSVELSFENGALVLDLLHGAAPEAAGPAYALTPLGRALRGLGQARRAARRSARPDPSPERTLAGFLDAVADGRPPGPPLADGLRVCDLVLRLRAAARPAPPAMRPTRAPLPGETR